jgi:tetratricopeptide (TPR) repeat protein
MPLWLVLLFAGCASMPEPAAPQVGPAARAASVAPAEGDAQATEDAVPPQALQRFDAAVVHMNAGDAAAAEQAFRALAADYPAFSGPLVNLGILEAKAGRFEDAERTLQAAIARTADNAAAFNQLGLVYRKLGRFQDAERAYREAVRIDPNYANAYLNLGVLCDLYLQQPKQALEAYERYLELTPEPDARVNAWVTEVRKRVGASAAPPRSEG